MSANIKWELIDQEPKIAAAVEDLSRHKCIAVDLEGKSLCRHGPITILAMATPTCAYLFDVKLLGAKVFTREISDLLETKEKLMFDCRADSEALYHQFHVTLGNVKDLQLLDLLVAEKRQRIKISEYENQMAAEFEMSLRPIRLRGLQKLLNTHAAGTSYLKAKSAVDMRRFGSDCWVERPLQKKMLEYASTDVLCLFHLYRKLLHCCPMIDEGRLVTGSETYLRIYRDRKDCQREDPVQTKALLPLEIFSSRHEGEDAVAKQYCEACQRQLPTKYFLHGDVRSYCAVCRRAAKEGEAS